MISIQLDWLVYAKYLPSDIIQYSSTEASREACRAAESKTSLRNNGYLLKVSISAHAKVEAAWGIKMPIELARLHYKISELA